MPQCCDGSARQLEFCGGLARVANVRLLGGLVVCVEAQLGSALEAALGVSSIRCECSWLPLYALLGSTFARNVLRGG